MTSDLGNLNMTYLKDINSRIEDNDYPGFLKIWEEYCYSDDFDSPEFIKILESVKKSPLVAKFGNHVEKGLALWEKIQDPNDAHEVLKLIFDIQTTNSDKLATIALEFLTNKYPEDPNYQEKLRLIGLRGGENFQGAISNYALLTHMKKGNFVFHHGGWGTSEILDVSLIREELSLECEYVIGAKSLSFSNAFKTLIPLVPDHFLSRRFGNPDLFEQQARENPSEIIRVLLRDLGPKTASEIKEELCDLVIPTKDWNRWWQTARHKIKKDTKIESPKNLKMPFRLREEEIPHEVSFYKALESKPSIPDTIQMVYTFMRDFSETLKNKEFKSSLETKIKSILDSENLPEEHELQLLFFIEDLPGKNEKSSCNTLIKEMENIPSLIQKIDIIAFKKRALTVVRKQRKDWKDIFFSLLFAIDQSLIRDYLLSEIVKSESIDELKLKLNELLVHPLSYPEVFIWYFQKILNKKTSLPFNDSEGRALFFEGFFVLLDHLGRKQDYRDLTKKMVALLLQNRYKIVRDIMAESSLESVQEFLLLATKCEVLSDHDIKIIHSLAEVVYPALSRLRKDEESEVEIVWSTQEAYQRVKEKIERIATVETVENVREIEEARSHGDLRENSEFKSALEKRDRLQGELKALSSQLSKARILTHADVTTDVVGIGVIVECKDSKENALRFTILGPWDADAEKNIISFQSKMAQAMKGKAVGESFNFQGEEFVIVDIQNFFDEK